MPRQKHPAPQPPALHLCWGFNSQVCNSTILPISLLLPKRCPQPDSWLRPARTGPALDPRPGCLPLPLPGLPQAAAIAALGANSCLSQRQPLPRAKVKDRAPGLGRGGEPGGSSQALRDLTPSGFSAGAGRASPRRARARRLPCGGAGGGWARLPPSPARNSLGSSRLRRAGGRGEGRRAGTPRPAAAQAAAGGGGRQLAGLGDRPGGSGEGRGRARLPSRGGGCPPGEGAAPAPVSITPVPLGPARRVAPAAVGACERLRSLPSGPGTLQD